VPVFATTSQRQKRFLRAKLVKAQAVSAKRLAQVEALSADLSFVESNVQAHTRKALLFPTRARSRRRETDRSRCCLLAIASRTAASKGRLARNIAPQAAGDARDVADTGERRAFDRDLRGAG